MTNSLFAHPFRWLIAVLCCTVLILSHVAVYYSGYYLASSEFQGYYTAESLNDRLAASLYLLYGDAQSDSDAGSLSQDDPGGEALGEAQESVSEQRDAQEKAPSLGQDESLSYDAYLIGFGVRRNAESYASRLKREGLPMRVISHDYTTARGRKIIWYQVVLGPLPYHELLEYVERLKNRDRLEGIVIMPSHQ